MDFRKIIENRARNIIKELDAAYGDLDSMISKVDVDNLPKKEQDEIRDGLNRLAEVEKIANPELTKLVNTLNKKRK